MAKIKEATVARIEDAKIRIAGTKAKHTAKKKNARTTNQILADSERKIALELEAMVSGTKEFDAKLKELETLRQTRLNGRVSADNVAAAVTSLTGVGGAIAYDSRANFPKLANPFLGKGIPFTTGKNKAK